jgi:hypothetical protein
MKNRPEVVEKCDFALHGEVVKAIRAAGVDECMPYYF